jgi:hypothetical protein
MSPSGGTVAATPQERALASNAMASFKDYQTRWLPVQDHLSSVVSDMAKPDSWQKQEAEGKGNVDVAQEFSKMNAQRNTSQMASGINVGSARFKMGIASGASAEAEARGMAVNTGEQAINKAYLANLGAISRTGQSLATSATQGQGAGGEVASRIAVSGAQEQNAVNAGNVSMATLGIGAIGGALNSPGSPTPNTNPTMTMDPAGTTYSGGGNYSPGLNINPAITSSYMPSLSPQQ